MKHNYPITATFIDEISFDIASNNFSKKEWKKELKIMKSVGIDTIVFIRGGLGAKNKCIYPSPTFKSFYDDNNDFLGDMLTIADQLKMKVYIGLYMETINWNNGDYKQMTEQNSIFIDEIMAKYGHHKSIFGWYIPTEVCMDEFNIIPTLENLVNMIKEKTPDKKVYFCPLFRTRILEPIENEFSFEQTYDVWDKILKNIGNKIDAISFTDGTAPMELLEGYIAATKKVCDKYHIDYWANVELFDRVQPGLFFPIQFEILKYKIDIMKKYCVKLNSFDFNHFMSPNSMYPSGKLLFKRYKEFYKKNS